MYIKTCLLNHSVMQCFTPFFLPVLITELHWLVEQQIKTNAFYRFQCHYPLITYLNLDLK